LKRIFTILSIILLTTVAVHAQRSPGPSPDHMVRFYPNPATTTITFDIQRNYEKGYQIQVYSFIGKMVYESKNVSNRTVINLNDYNRGVYVFQLRDANGKILESGKFQVAR